MCWWLEPALRQRPTPVHQRRWAVSSNRARTLRRSPPAQSRHHATQHSPVACLFLLFLSGGADFPVDLGAIDRIAVPAQRAVERGDRFIEAAHLQQNVAIVILNDRIGLQLV